MNKSGKSMDNFTKSYQKSEGNNPTISYKETGTGIQATVTAGGNEYHSNSHSSRDEARAEASKMANDSLGSVLNLKSEL
jgi:hypothetical protein